MQYLHPPLTSCITYLICNTRIKGHVEISICWSKFTTVNLWPQNVIFTLVLCQNHMSNMTHAIFIYKQILNWENMSVYKYYIIGWYNSWHFRTHVWVSHSCDIVNQKNWWKFWECNVGVAMWQCCKKHVNDIDMGIT
jgi:hypothetical protein